MRRTGYVIPGIRQWNAWRVYAAHPGRWYAGAPWALDVTSGGGPFPSWREAYDYAHTHPSNRKETP